jgi:hypothetical protein
MHYKCIIIKLHFTQCCKMIVWNNEYIYIYFFFCCCTHSSLNPPHHFIDNISLPFETLSYDLHCNISCYKKTIIYTIIFFTPCYLTVNFTPTIHKHHKIQNGKFLKFWTYCIITSFLLQALCIYTKMRKLCILRRGYPDWGFSVLFPRL